MTHAVERQFESTAKQTLAVPSPRTQLAWVRPLARHALLIIVAALLLLPFYWMVVSALKSNSDIFARPLQWWPEPIQWQNFGDTIGSRYFPYFRLLGNSVFFAGGVTIGTVLSCAAVGYGFARLRFPGRDLLFGITLATLMIPPIVTFIPTYVLFAKLQLIGGYTPLILPAFFGNAFFIFMMRQFFLGIPRDLSDAARIDGAGEFRIFWQIMLPLVRPALMVVAVFSLLYTWHDFFGPLIYLQDQSQFPLSLGLYAFKSQRTAEWARIMMGSFLTTLPLIIVFLFTQRYFLRGIATTGLKG
jgi:multiple sugar transport system permease protein